MSPTPAFRSAPDFIYIGELLFSTTPQIFTAPRGKRTENYVTGRFG